MERFHIKPAFQVSLETLRMLATKGLLCLMAAISQHRGAAALFGLVRSLGHRVTMVVSPFL